MKLRKRLRNAKNADEFNQIVRNARNAKQPINKNRKISKNTTDWSKQYNKGFVGSELVTHQLYN